MTPRPHFALQNSHWYAKEFIHNFMYYLGMRPQKVSPAPHDHLKMDSSAWSQSCVLPVTSSLHKIYKRTRNGEATFVTADML